MDLEVRLPDSNRWTLVALAAPIATGSFEVPQLPEPPASIELKMTSPYQDGGCQLQIKSIGAAYIP